MSREAKQELTQYLNDHCKLVLATAGPAGTLAHTVEYVADGTTVYFMTHGQSRKVQNITADPAVGYTVDEDYEDWSAIKGIQMQGKAAVVTDPAELKKGQGLLMQRFPQLAQMPALDGMVMVKVAPARALYIDNTVQYGYRDQVDF